MADVQGNERIGLTTLALAGVLGGVLLVVIDVVTLRGAAPRSHDGALYAVTVAMIAGGILAAVAAAAGRVGRWPVAAVLAALFCYWNRTLTSGGWISEQWWSPILLVAVMLVGSLGLLAAVSVAGRISSGPAALRSGTAVLMVAAGLGASGVSLRLFGPYPLVRDQLAVVTLASVVLGPALLLPRTPGRRLRIAVLIMVLSALAGAVWLRTTPDIVRARAAILGSPYAATSRIMPGVERLLDLVAPLPPLVSDEDAPLRFGPDVTPAEARRLWAERVPELRGMNVLCVAVDALRGDRFRPPKGARVVMPELGRFAGEAIVFERAVTPAPASAAAYHSVMSGLRPQACVRAATSAVAARKRMLPHALGKHGFHTEWRAGFRSGFTDQPLLAPLKDAFETYVDRSPGLSAVEIVDQGLASMRRHATDGRRFFLWLHVMEPHAPYELHPEFDFGTSARDAYDSEVALVDRELGRLFAGMRAGGLLERTVVIVFGDHGESFGEHNLYHHGGGLWEHQMRVPFMVRVPGLPGKSVASWVSTGDLVPTVLSMLDVPDDEPRFGRDLTALLVGDPARWADVAYAELPVERVDMEQRAVWHGDLKVIWNKSLATVSAYDLGRDPGELSDIFDPSDALHRRLLATARQLDRGGSSSDHPGEPATLVELVDRFVDGEGGDDDRRRLARLRDIAFARPRADVRDEVRADRLERLQDRLRAAARENPAGSVISRDALMILLRLGGRVADEAARAELARTPHPVARAMLAGHLAARGDAAHRDVLEQSARQPQVDVRLEAAIGLAHLGSDAGRELLIPALDLESPWLVARTIDALTALGERWPLHRAMLDSDPAWRHPLIAEALLRQARADRTPAGLMSLVQLACTSAPSIASEAKRIGLERAGERRWAELERASGAFVNVRGEAHPPSAMRALAAWVAAPEATVGPWHTLSAVLAHRTGDRQTAVREYTKVAACLPDDDRLARAVRRARERVDEGPIISPEQVKLSAAVLDISRAVPMRRQLFLTRVRLTNDGSPWLPPRTARGQLVLKWSLENQDEVTSGPLIWLPPGGLLPGESVEVSLFGRMPQTPGRYVPVLTLQDARGRFRKVILTLPALDLRGLR